MSFRGVTFGGENVTPANDGGLYAAHHGDGILWGCSMSLSADGTQLIVSSGEFIACGRVVQVDGSTSVDLSGVGITTGYAQVIMNLDLTASPVYYESIVTSASTSFPTLTQGNLNNADTLYQIEMAVVTISGGVGSAVYSTMPYSSVLATDANGTLVTMRALGSSSGFRIGEQDSSGSSLRGMSTNSSGDLFLYSDIHDIYFRPNGLTDSTGQTYFDTDGQLHNALIRQTTDSSTSASMSSGWNTLLSLTPTSSGLYLCQGMVLIKGLGTSSTASATINIGVSTGSYPGRQRASLNESSSGTVAINTTFIYDGSSTINLYCNPSATATRTYCSLQIVQLA